MNIYDKIKKKNNKEKLRNTKKGELMEKIELKKELEKSQEILNNIGRLL